MKKAKGRVFYWEQAIGLAGLSTLIYIVTHWLDRPIAYGDPYSMIGGMVVTLILIVAMFTCVYLISNDWGEE